MKKIFGWFTYNCWLLFGGYRTERGFKFLSDSIIKNRKLINELKTDFRELSQQVSKLEKSNPQDPISSEVSGMKLEVDRLNSKIERCLASSQNFKNES